MPLHSDVLVDFNYMLSGEIGKEAGLEYSEIEGLFPQVKEIQRGLKNLRQLGQLQFFDLPFNEKEGEEIAREGKKAYETFSDVVVLGIGGSALGPAAIYDCIKPPFERLNPARKGPRLFVIDNVDPSVWKALLNVTSLKSTLFIVISKSGRTIETLAALGWFRELLLKSVGTCKKNLVIITDPKEGPLRRLADSEGILSFPIPVGVGGRFSVLTPVGLFPAACVGVDIMSLLSGAKRMAERSENRDIWTNAPYMSAILHLLIATKKGRKNRILFPYCERLESYTEWFCQLWAESLGKGKTLAGEGIETGATAVRAMGATDQHSQLQLYLDGPRDKVVTFFTLEDGSTETIPPSCDEVTEPPGLKGVQVARLLEIEYKATEQALRKCGVPSLAIRLPRLDEQTLGQLFFLAELETVVCGELYNINPFDQPAVELVKKYIKGLLGKEIELPHPNPRFVI